MRGIKELYTMAKTSRCDLKYGLVFGVIDQMMNTCDGRVRYPFLL